MKIRTYSDVKVNIKTNDIRKQWVIYCLTFPNGKQYIGQTTQELKERIRGHCNNATNKKDNQFNNLKARAIRKYMEFSVSVLYQSESFDLLELDKMEQYYIKEYDTFNNGYNLTEGGGGCIGIKHSEKTKKLILENSPNKIKVYQYDLEGNYLKEFESANQAALSLGDREKYTPNIINCINEKRQVAFNYRWKKERVDKLPALEGNWILPVYQYNLEDTLIQKFNSPKEASLFIKGDYSGTNSINRCARGERKTAYGFIWKRT